MHSDLNENSLEWSRFARRSYFCVFLIFISAMLASSRQPLQAAGIDVDLKAMRKAIFKVRVNSQSPDYRQPWALKQMVSSSGTGFYIGERSILTNAHVVAQGKFISVLKDGDDQPVSARVKYIAHDCDLALLEVLDPNYFNGVSPLEFGDLPEVRETVNTIGYPSGGEQLSITQGVVSRISYRRYVHTGTDSHLLIQVDSAINPGNSGGPVTQGSDVVGVAFQTQTAAENTGYIIPTPVVQRFLQDIKDGHYDGHPVQGIWLMDEALENSAGRAYHGLRPGEGGVKVSKVSSYSPMFNLIKPGDILLAIDGQLIGVDGKIKLFNERLSFRALYDLKQVGDSVTFHVLREGNRTAIEVPLKSQSDFYEPGETFEIRPRFLVFAGHVFTALSRSYLKVWGGNWSTDAPLILRYIQGFSTQLAEFRSKRDIIVLSDRLPHAVNAYAGPYLEEVLMQVNGRDVGSLEDLSQQFADAKTEFLNLQFWQKKVPYIISTKAARAADPLILEQYKIPINHWFGQQGADGATADWEDAP